MINYELGEVNSISVYPVTGVAGYAVEHVPFIGGGGLQGDRAWVAYDAAIDPTTKSNRLSLKRFREQFARLRLDHKVTDRLNLHLDGQSEPWLSLDEAFEGQVENLVNEFGDLTPTIDAGDEAAEQFSSLLGVPTARLARKSDEWLLGLPGTLPPRQRKVAPLHIVTQASVDALTHKEGLGVGINYDYRRFRPSLVIGGNFRPGEELKWIGTSLLIGQTIVKMVRPTIRCPVPGYDPETGENLKDVPKHYPDLIQEVDGETKPVFGVYGFALVSPPRDFHYISNGATVRMASPMPSSF